MSEEPKLLPCPFCGEAAELPDGDGTQYEIECGECGQAMASVQICDLMTSNERAAETFTNYRYGEQFVERAKLVAIERWNTRCEPAVPEGYALVPVEPTPEMLDVAVSFALNVSLSGEYNWSAYMRDVWLRMSAAAPGGAK